MNDKQIEIMLRQLIEEHLADDAEAALEWLDKRVIAYNEKMQELGLLDGDGEGDEDE